MTEIFHALAATHATGGRAERRRQRAIAVAASLRERRRCERRWRRRRRRAYRWCVGDSVSSSSSSSSSSSRSERHLYHTHPFWRRRGPRRRRAGLAVCRGQRRRRSDDPGRRFSAFILCHERKGSTWGGWWTGRNGGVEGSTVGSYESGHDGGSAVVERPYRSSAGCFSPATLSGDRRLERVGVGDDRRFGTAAGVS